MWDPGKRVELDGYVLGGAIEGERDAKLISDVWQTHLKSH